MDCRSPSVYPAFEIFKLEYRLQPTVTATTTVKARTATDTVFGKIRHFPTLVDFRAYKDDNESVVSAPLLPTSPP